MSLRCGKSISTFLRIFIEMSYCLVSATGTVFSGNLCRRALRLRALEHAEQAARTIGAAIISSGVKYGVPWVENLAQCAEILDCKTDAVEQGDLAVFAVPLCLALELVRAVVKAPSRRLGHGRDHFGPTETKGTQVSSEGNCGNGNSSGGYLGAGA